MNLLALLALAALATPNPELPPLPITPTEPLLSYMACLFEPTRERLKGGAPVPKAEREATVRAILQSCASVRTTAGKTAFERSETLPTVVEQNARKTLIEAYLSRFDEQLRFIIVDHEKFIAESDTYCRKQGQEPGC